MRATWTDAECVRLALDEVRTSGVLDTVKTGGGEFECLAAFYFARRTFHQLPILMK